MLFRSLVETESEVNSRTEQSKYNLYSSHNTNHIVGIINSNMRTYTVHLGNRSDPSSKISQIMKAVNAMPSNNTFTKKELSESLPSNLAKAHVLKLALDYMIHIGQVKRVRKDIETGAVLYQRLKSEDSSSNNLGSEAAEAINLNSSAL